MSAQQSPMASLANLGQRPRRGSLASTTGPSPLDQEHLAQALDKIHTSASHSDTLTTFSEFAPPPPPSHVESKGLAGDIMQNGLSGLYSRFRGAVVGGKDKANTSMPKSDADSFDSQSVRSQNAGTSGKSVSTINREDSGVASSPAPISSSSSRLQSPMTLSFVGNTSESTQHTNISVKPQVPSATATTSTSKITSARPSIASMSQGAPSGVIVPTLDPVNVSAFKETSRGRVSNEKWSGHRTPSMGAHSQSSRGEQMERIVLPDLASYEASPSSKDRSRKASMSRDMGNDGSADASQSSKSVGTGVRATSSPPQKRSLAIDRITQSHLPGYSASRASSSDRSLADITPVNTSAHNSVRHESFSLNEGAKAEPGKKVRIPGTTHNEGAPEAVSTRLEQMRKQVLSKEFWMADEICKECFLCGDTFSAFRRKHHCRTCGCIFDNKCTAIVSGQRFGVHGSLRVCKTCLDVINRRHDSSGSDDSGDEAILPSFFQTQQAKYQARNKSESTETDNVDVEPSATAKDTRPLATPMMAIPTRRVGDSSNRRSAILEIDAPQLSRPSSSRSLKALSTPVRPPSSSHKRHLSKHNLFGRFKPTPDTRAPFHRGAAEDKTSRLPAFHDDNIIDPDLAPYMSDEESSGNEQLSIFATMNSNDNLSRSYDNDRTGFGSLLGSTKKHRSRNDKSISGLSLAGRSGEDLNANAGSTGFLRNNRRRNLSAASNILHHSRTSPRQNTPGISNLDEEVSQGDGLSIGAGQPPPSRMTRSASMRDARAPVVELNSASLHHVKRLLRQLLQDANIPNVAGWEKALLPILLQCTDDVNPDVRSGDDIDIRHYVKLKKIPGGKPGDTSYVSGVVFTKNLALKSMPRSITNPRIVIVSFPIEYQRHQQHFMSLGPVIAQEKDFLKNMVNRIASLRPQVLLVQKHISGLALQYLAEAGIAVAYNVKQSVIEAVSRCAQTEIISSIDMVALKPVHVGRCAGFDVKTYVHNDMPGKKKTYLYMSGCPKELGCTIALRGANMETLTKMKNITEFMVYVVYNLKLETCLMRDEFVLVPSVEEISGSLSLGKNQNSDSLTSSVTESTTSNNIQESAETGFSETNEAVKSSELDTSSTSTEIAIAALPQDGAADQPVEQSKTVSAHQSHTHESPEDQVPDDTPMPTFYSDMVAKHQTKILSASPFVKFSQPYLLMRARELERRLVHLKKLRDQDTYEEQTDVEKAKPQRFQLIRPEMVHERLNKAPRAIMEVLHAVHDAEYDKALHNYQTQKRQWENYIQGNLNLFDPYAHQKITVLYTVVCTTTSIPCAGPELFALAFYNEHGDFDGDCTLGQYVEDLCMTAGTVCASSGCDRKMAEHHRTYVHGEARVTIFVEKSPCKIKGLEDSILMWSYCKICQKETQVMPMSESTWKYSFGKYLELSFWSSDLRLRAGVCPHNLHRDHLRYFGFRNLAIRIHYDPIDLLEIVVPRMRITWKVENDLRLKNEVFTKIEDRWNRFMTSVHSRIKGINIDSVATDKAEACKAEVERLKKHAQDEHAALIKKLQQKYMESKYYEVVPLNRALRAMAEKAAEWDEAFASFDANYFPSERDIRRLAALQLKKMFMDRDESTSSLVSNDASDLTSDVDEKSIGTSLELTRRASTMTVADAREALVSAVEEMSSPPDPPGPQDSIAAVTSELEQKETMIDHDRVEHLDLAIPTSPDSATATPIAIFNTGNPMDALPETALDTSIDPDDASPEASLSEKVERLRKAHRTSEDQTGAYASNIPRPTERMTTRKSGQATSPPLNRTQSQPTGTLSRSQTITKHNFKQAESRPGMGSAAPSAETVKSITSDSVKASDKKLSERLGLGTLRSKKTGQSLIPRSINSKRKESKVSTLAKHFEQLSREFEKERLKDRRQRAAKVTQSRAFPKASSKPIVEVYKDVNEAVVERSPEQDLESVEALNKNTEPTSTISGLADLNIEDKTIEMGPNSPTDTAITADDTATEAETEDLHTASHAGSDDEGMNSDTEPILMEDILPGAADLADALDKPDSDIPLELPKHEKTSLMKMLTNFWAERSASGWTPLDYPLGVGDHIFTDEDVIIREDEPSSLIAFALNCPHYRSALEEFRDQGRVTSQEREGEAGEGEGATQADVETTLLRATGTHLAYVFVNGTARMQCKIFFAEQFDAVRRKCGVSERVVESLSRCLKWDSKGGKTKAVFLKTLDDRFVLKQLSQIETAAFLKFAPAYFNIMAEALFHDLPSVIAKMLGFYQIIIKNPTTGVEIKWDILVMENLFYDRVPKLTFDLKGSMRNRKIEKTGEQNEVLLDENMVELIYESPLFAREHSKKLLRAAIFNDTLFLQRNDVMDYSLMVAVDEARKELVVGIIDVVRTYTWDKKLESWIKDRGFAGGGRNRPTVTSPKEYKSRFREAMNRYILQAPNSWHQWQGSLENKARDSKGGSVTFADKD